MNTLWQLNDITLSGRKASRLSIPLLDVQPGVTAVLGQSGAGKSSLLGLLADFEPPASGSLQFHGATNSNRPSRYWSPQDHGLWPHLSVHDHIDVVRVKQEDSNSPLAKSCDEWIELFDLQALASSLPGELSMGERSRLSVLRAIASQAECLIMDEPLAHVDVARLDSYWQIVEQHISQTKTSLVFSTHDESCVRRFADHCICLENGQLAFTGSARSLYLEPPTESLAWLLGPANFSATSDFDFLQRDPGHSLPKCIRPEELRFETDDQGRDVKSVRDVGGAFATVLDGMERPVFLNEGACGRVSIKYQPVHRDS